MVCMMWRGTAAQPVRTAVISAVPVDLEPSRQRAPSRIESKRSPNSAPLTSGMRAVRCATMVSARGPWRRATGHGLGRTVLLRQTVPWRSTGDAQGDAGPKSSSPRCSCEQFGPVRLASIRMRPLQLRSSGVSGAMVCFGPAQYGTGSRARDASPGRLCLCL